MTLFWLGFVFGFLASPIVGAIVLAAIEWLEDRAARKALAARRRQVHDG